MEHGVGCVNKWWVNNVGIVLKKNDVFLSFPS